MLENEIARIVVDACVTIHRRLGPGLMESMYEFVLSQELERRGLRVRRQVAVPVEWEGVRHSIGFRVDLIVNDLVMVELKSSEHMSPVYVKQLLTYLRLTGKRLGLVANFGMALAKDGLKRVVNNLPEAERI